MTDPKSPVEQRVIAPVDPTRRTEIDKQRVPMAARPYRLLAMVKQDAIVRHSGPLIPPSLRIRQKWTARKTAVMSGSAMTWST